MRKVLFVVYYFPPLGGGGVQRTVKFAQYLPEFGWQPQILTVRNPHYLVEDTSLQDELPSNLPVTRTVGLLPARFFRKALRHDAASLQDNVNAITWLANFGKKLFYTCVFIPDEYIGWWWPAVRAGCKIIAEEGIDVIYSSGPPNTTHLIARSLARRTGRPWLADLRDLWDQYPDSYNPFNWQWRQRLDQRLERSVLSVAERLIVVSEQMRTQIRQRFSDRPDEHVAVITNGFDPPDFASLLPPVRPDRFVIVHSGTLFSWRSLRPFLAALRRVLDGRSLKRRPLLKLLGIVPAGERQAIAGYDLANEVEILDYLPYRSSLAHLLGADVLLLLIGNLPHATNMMTSKLFDYLGANRPILVIGPDCTAKELVQSERRGEVFYEHETARIVSTVTHWINSEPPAVRAKLQTSSNRFHRRQLTGKLAGIFDSVVNETQLKPKGASADE